MNLRLYNTLSKKEEDFNPLKPPSVGIYMCGLTVYDYDHIGHMRTYINSDVLIRVLEYKSFAPKTVMNITDVGHLTSDADTGEDKMEKGAKREGKTVWQIAQFYTDHFFASTKKLNIKKPDIVCKATDHISQMIELVKKLEEKGFIYKTSDGIYFDTSKFKNYGQLANLDIEGLKEGARVEKNPEKKNPTDFALWRFSPSAGSGQKRQMEWDSPWGVGFPGWHIECSAMSMHYLGETLDIHTGGIDHIPVHHTNEIAQSEAASGKPFVKYWFHSNHLMVEGQKMSKSLGNFIKVEDLEKKGFDPLALRYLFLTGHYRTQMNFTWEALKGAQQTLDKLYEYVDNFRQEKGRIALSEENMDKIEKFKEEFTKALDDDLAMPQAVSLIWQVVKSNIPSTDKYDLLIDWDQVFGLDLGRAKSKPSSRAFGPSSCRGVQVEGEQRAKIDKVTKELLAKREELRQAGKWQEADKIRKELEKKYVIRDTASGTVIEPKRGV